MKSSEVQFTIGPKYSCTMLSLEQKFSKKFKDKQELGQTAIFLAGRASVMHEKPYSDTPAAVSTASALRAHHHAAGLQRTTRSPHLRLPLSGKLFCKVTPLWVPHHTFCYSIIRSLQSLKSN